MSPQRAAQADKYPDLTPMVEMEALAAGALNLFLGQEVEPQEMEALTVRMGQRMADQGKAQPPGNGG